MGWLSWFRKQEPEPLAEEPVNTNKATNGKKAIGFSENEILLGWATRVYKDDFVILLKNINLASKNSDYWYKIPADIRSQFTRDFVVLFCKDEQEVRNIVSSITTKFAEAFGICLGRVTYINEDEEDVKEL